MSTSRLEKFIFQRQYKSRWFPRITFHLLIL